MCMTSNGNFPFSCAICKFKFFSNSNFFLFREFNFLEQCAEKLKVGKISSASGNLFYEKYISVTHKTSCFRLLQSAIVLINVKREKCS